MQIDTIESLVRERFDSAIYNPRKITQPVTLSPVTYFEKATLAKLQFIQENTPQERKLILDLGCSNGEHLQYTSSRNSISIGVDLSMSFLQNAAEKLKENPSIRLICGNAKSLPFKSDSFDMIYSISTLYCMPTIKHILKEISRILRPGGRFVFDFANLWSLNTLVVSSYPEYAPSVHVRIPSLKKWISGANFQLLKHRAMQILPLWGNRPWWLRPLLHPVWEQILRLKLGKYMLDEWFSATPFLKLFAFRHIFLCEKRQVGS